MLSKGTPNGFKTSTLVGGQEENKSTQTLKLEWKKDQKKPKKNKTSELINQTILINKLLWTEAVWKPRYKDSRTTSRHQKKLKKKIKITLTKKIDIEDILNINKALETKKKKAIDLKKGQGELSTKWKGVLRKQE